jgi:pfkB family carbohydrate kinase
VEPQPGYPEPVIVVIGSPIGRSEAGRSVAAGASADIAIAAAATGAPVQLVGRIGDDPVADAVLADLSRRGVGHVAILRDAAHPTPLDRSARPAGPVSAEPAGLPLDAQDVSLALRYLIDVTVLVVLPGAPPAVLEVVADAAGWAGAGVVAFNPARDEATGAFVARVAAAAVREATLRSAR